MGLNIKRDRLCLIQLTDERQQEVHLIQLRGKNYSVPNLRKFLGDEKRTKLFHFARFDMAIIKHYCQIEMRNIFCTKIASKLVRTYTESHGLKDLCRDLLGVVLSKQSTCSYWGAKELSFEQKDYAAKDVIYLHTICSRLMDMLRKEGRLEMAEEIFRFLPRRVQLDLDWGMDDIFAH